MNTETAKKWTVGKREDEQAEQPTKQACERAGLEEDVLVEDSSAEALERLLRDVAAGAEHRPQRQPQGHEIHHGRGRFEAPHHDDDHPAHQRGNDDGGPTGEKQAPLPVASSACCCSYRFALSGSRMV